LSSDTSPNPVSRLAIIMYLTTLRAVFTPEICLPRGGIQVVLAWPVLAFMGLKYGSIAKGQDVAGEVLLDLDPFGNESQISFYKFLRCFNVVLFDPAGSEKGFTGGIDDVPLLAWSDLVSISWKRSQHVGDKGLSIPHIVPGGCAEPNQDKFF
jgi:hypothetical protein